MKIPLVDLKRQYQTISKEIDQAIARVIKDSAFILGKYTEDFEVAFANYCGIKYCVGLNSGTDALHLAYHAVGVGKTDEVITVAKTFFATTEPLHHLGATPVFVDIDPQTYLIDPKQIEPAITKKTKAIVAVHLYGQMADMTAIMKIARRHKIKVIEDCSQAHGAEHFGKKAGLYGDIGVYSFYPGKNLGAYGDAGAIVTNNKKYADLIRKLRDHGRVSKYEHELFAHSSRMDGIQAAVLSVKLAHLNKWIKARRRIAGLYDNYLPKHLKKPVELKDNHHVYHLYTIEVENRDRVFTKLREQGIEAGIHYPVPLHLQPVYRQFGFAVAGSLPVTERVAQGILSLPIFPEMTDQEVEYVVTKLKDSL